MLPKRSQAKLPPRSPPKKTAIEDNGLTYPSTTVRSPHPENRANHRRNLFSKQGRDNQIGVLQHFSQDQSLQRPSSPASEQQQCVDLLHIHALERQFQNIMCTLATMTAQETKRRDSTASGFNYCSECQRILKAPLKCTYTCPT